MSSARMLVDDSDEYYELVNSFVDFMMPEFASWLNHHTRDEIWECYSEIVTKILSEWIKQSEDSTATQVNIIGDNHGSISL